MGFYSRVVFPCLYDFLMDRPHWAKHRERQLASAGGEILEIGAGTGLNLAHYPPHVRKITTIDPNPGMNRRLRRRVAKSGIEVDEQLSQGETLPFEDASFDCVVSTLVMCSLQDVEQALAEVHRVLRPGGQLLFLEHGASSDPAVLRWQRRLNWLQRRLADGCRLDVDIADLLAQQPFCSVTVDNYYMERAPKTYGYIYQGVAVKS